MKTKTTKRSLALAAVMVMLVSCSSKPKVKEFPDSANVQDELANAQVAMDNSRKDNVDLLAPTDFKEADKTLKEARHLEKDDRSDKRVLEEVALSRGYLERAKKTAQKNQSRMPDVLAARNAAIAAQANVLVAGPFASLDKKVKVETAKVENDENDEIKENRNKFVTGYYDLELAAIKQSSIGEARTLIDGAVNKGAKDLAPQTLAAANTAYGEADSYITMNRHNKSEIQIKSAAAITAAQKLDRTTDTARGLTSGSPEDAALRLQAEEENLTRTKTSLTEEQAANAALVATNSKLSEKDQVNQAYEKARSKFSPEEAEVYKQGDKLVIRLRSLEFPKNESVLRGSNFSVLKKVDDVIGDFKKSSVTVEGHTDSTGGRALNQKLSDARASAVMQYLEANSSESVSEFTSKGYGFEKPIASNKSAEGRAQNRRVDVIIEPEQL